MEKIGFIGLGSIGKPMCKCLVSAGYNVTVHDIRKEAQDELVQMGAKGVSSPRQMAEACDVIITMVRNDAETEEVILGEDGIIGGMSTGKVIVVMSTVSPDLCQRIANMVSEKGGSVIDAAVSGGVAVAEQGALTIMVGGDKRDFHRCLPVLERMGKHVYHVGGIGRGEATKIINNLVTNATFFATVEALKLAKAMGIDIRSTIEIMKLSSGSSWNLENWDFMVGRRRADAPEEIRRMCYKDIGLGVGLARQYHADLPIAKCCLGIDITSNVESLLH